LCGKKWRISSAHEAIADATEIHRARFCATHASFGGSEKSNNIGGDFECRQAHHTSARIKRIQAE